MINVALNCPATQSSTSIWSSSSDPTQDARVATNGDRTAPLWFHTSVEVDPWWQVDLGEFFLIKQVIIFNRLDKQERLRHFTLLRSQNGRDWFEFFRKTDDAAFAEFCADITSECLARFIRVRLDGQDCLHFRECQVFGEPANSLDRARLLAADARLLSDRQYIPEGRKGHITSVGGFNVFVDEENYGRDVVWALDQGDYEEAERNLVKDFLLPTDRVLEIGTAVGVVSMTAAKIVGPNNVLTFDANPEIAADAKDNFRRNRLSDIVSEVGVLVCRKHFRENEQVEFFIDKEFWASRLDANSSSDGIINTVKVPTLCLEQIISSHNATVLICDIEGGEVNLLSEADLSGIRVIIIETHYWAVGETVTDSMIRNLILQGFSLHLGASRERAFLST